MKIIFLGDSITEGFGLSAPDKKYVNLVKMRFRARCVITVSVDLVSQER